jgi:hypothetical protein
MKPFDLAAAQRGNPLVTRDGRKARFIAYVPECEPSRRIYAFVDGADRVFDFTENGRRIRHDSTDRADLFMAPVKRTFWVNLMAGGPAAWFSNERAAQMAEHTYQVVARAVCVEVED